MSASAIPFEALGDRRFQLFCQSLLTYEFPGLRALPVGQPDGGRDALVLRARGEDSTVFQVKFVERPDYLKDPEQWIRGVIGEELPKIERLLDLGMRSYRLITNVPGSAHLGNGSIDIGERVLQELVPIESQIWWRNDVAIRLAKHRELKWAYRELLTGEDVLDELVASGLNEDRERRSDAITAALAAQYDADRMVRFKQVDLQNDLLDLFVDVPAGDSLMTQMRLRRDMKSAGISRPSTHRGIADGSEQEHGAAELLLADVPLAGVSRWVVEGAPGQGKSTLAQYLCQVHRARLLQRAGDLERLRASHRDAPMRLPFKVEAREFAAFLNGEDPYAAVPGWGGIPAQWPRSLEGMLALQVVRYSGGAQFSVSDLFAVARTGPVLLVLDGLDEVADVGDRRKVVETVMSGLAALEHVASSLQVVVTSRPAAFANSPGFPAGAFAYLTLSSLTPVLIADYAARWTRARRLTQQEASEILAILTERLIEEHIRELARNPMQLAILLTLINTKGESLPDRRTLLYSEYVGLFFDRESAKSQLVKRNRDLLYGLHGHLAWLLHGAAEEAAQEGSIAIEQLRAVVQDYVLEHRGDPALTEELFQGVVERIFALVLNKEDRFEFEVQPLREFFAAWHLYTTSQVSQFDVRRTGTRADRFAALARNGYWLNVVRFFAGFYTSGELPSLADGLELLADDAALARTGLPRALAAVLLADWSFSLDPRSRDRAIQQVLRGFGTRHVLGQVGQHGTLRLPQDAGRAEVASAAIALLEHDSLAGDRRRVAAHVLAEHLDPQRARELLDRIERSTGAARTRWLAVAARCRVLEPMAADRLEALTVAEGDAAATRERVRELLRMGADEAIEASPQLTRVAIEAILRGEPCAAQPHASLLGTFHMLCSVGALDPLGGADGLEDVPCGGEHLALCQRVVELAQELRTSPPMLMWSQIIDACAESAPTCELPVQMAVTIAGLMPHKEARREAADLGDGPRTLSQRVLEARAHAGADDRERWLRLLREARGERDVQAAVLCTVRWAAGDALRAALPALHERVEELSAQRYDFLAWASDQATTWRARHALGLPVSELRRMSPRVALLLSYQASPEKQLWSYRLGSYSGSDPTILAHAVRRLGRRRKPDWERLLDLLRKLQQADADWPRHPSFDRFAPPSEAVARTVLERADEYPLILVEAAERKLHSAYGKKARPISRAAQQERWFVRS